MSEKLRSVNTKFWDDPFIEELTPSEKLLFLYLLTNPQANLLGIYEITIKRICYDTGLQKETVTNGLERFGRVRKAFYCGSYIILPNWLKNQKLNKNMKIAVGREFNSLPKELKDNILGNGSESLGNGSEGYGMIMERLGKYEIEIEDEIEDEVEAEIKIDFILFWDLYHITTGLSKSDKDAAEKYWKKLKKEDQQKAIDNIKPYFDSLNDKKYCKKARTYLADKNFNDEFKKPEPVPIVKPKVYREGDLIPDENWVEPQRMSNANR